MSLVTRSLAIVLAFTITMSPLGGVVSAEASVGDWQKGVSIVPQSPTDFTSATFEQSVRNAAADGANYVTLIYPLYQTDESSTDIQSGWNTPTDDSLASAIDYIHSLGMHVAIKVHLDPLDGVWRAYINPTDRSTWFQKYGDVLVHIGQIGQAHGAEMFVLGVELVSMTSYTMNPTNTENWQALIARVRAVYNGGLTYSASSTGFDPNPYTNEKSYIQFWNLLDYAGLSAYYDLNTSNNDVNSLMSQWDYWNQNDIKNFEASVSKPILITELGYRSLDNAHVWPWNWSVDGAINQTEQANDYQALFQYWNNYPYLAGMYLWDWSSDPNAGGNDNSYTPQNKLAEAVMAQWFKSPPTGGSDTSSTSPSTLPPTSSGTFTSSVTNSTVSTAGTLDTLTTTINVPDGTLNQGIIDLEIYDTSNTRVFQQFYENQNIVSGTPATYQSSWTPPASGTYRVAVGVFTTGWGSLLNWNNNALQITVGQTQAPSTATSTPDTTLTPSGAYTTNVWWPTDGSHVSGLQPFKINFDGLDASHYQTYWQVDGGQLNQMSENQTDYPHQEAAVDLTNWSWEGAGPYKINFVSKDSSGAIISHKEVNIYIP